MPIRPPIATALALIAGAKLAAQNPSACWTRGSITALDATERTADALGRRSVRSTPIRGTAPAIDGRLVEDVWCVPQAAEDFVQSSPAPGSLATLASSARVVFDDAAVYIGIRLFDAHSDSIVAPFPRRDDEVTSDWVFVELDTRFDRRSGFSFGLNPRGVQVDGSWWDDVNYDAAWNGVWQGAAAVDAGGWTAEFRIPFSQLALARSAPGASLTWGLNIYRYAPHRGETSNWSPRLPSVAGVVSHFNRLEGIAAPPRGARIEMVPYASVTDVHAPPGESDGITHRVGGDIRVRPTPSTIGLVSAHPDFGQVEADPSQVNLTTFETFLQEQRPVFVEGADLLRFPAGLVFSSRGTSFSDESPFYSRRIGRAPQSSPPSGFRTDALPSAATVLAAARMSARGVNGWSGGVFHSWTDVAHVRGVDSSGTRARVQLEPLTSYSVGRLARESRDGTGSLGLMATAVHRLHLSARADSELPRDAVVAGTDVRKRSGNYDLTAFVLGSRVVGSTAAIGALRGAARHGYHRAPGLAAAPPNDTTHRALSGVAAQARLARTAGALHWGLAGRLVSRGFEANDAGFQRNADWLLVAGDWKYQRFRAGSRLRRWSVGSDNLGVGWTTHGDRRAGIVTVTLSGDMRSYHGGSVTAGRELSAKDPEVLRGGPALLLPERDRLSVHLYSDTRRAWQFTLDAAAEREGATASGRGSLAPGVDAFVTDRLQIGLSPSVAWNREAWQYVARATAPTSDASGAAPYVLGQLDQREVSLTTRATAAFSSHLTLQWYAQVFLSGGRYARFFEVRSPSAANPADRVAPIAAARLQHDSIAGTYVLDGGTGPGTTFRDPAFSDRSFHVNTVLRWEFLPGSTAFLVWTQERGDRAAAPFHVDRDLHRLTRAAPTNALQLKLTYWIAP